MLTLSVCTSELNGVFIQDLLMYCKCLVPMKSESAVDIWIFNALSPVDESISVYELFFCTVLWGFELQFFSLLFVVIQYRSSSPACTLSVYVCVCLSLCVFLCGWFCTRLSLSLSLCVSLSFSLCFFLAFLYVSLCGWAFVCVSVYVFVFFFEFSLCGFVCLCVCVCVLTVLLHELLDWQVFCFLALVRVFLGFCFLALVGVCVWFFVFLFVCSDAC